jgi:hypothetical protein
MLMILLISKLTCLSLQFNRVDRHACHVLIRAVERRCQFACSFFDVQDEAEILVLNLDDSLPIPTKWSGSGDGNSCNERQGYRLNDPHCFDPFTLKWQLIFLRLHDLDGRQKENC